MNQDQFTVVYNVLDHTLSDYSFSFGGGLFIAVGLILVFAPQLFFWRKTLAKGSRAAIRMFGSVFLTFAFVWTISTVMRIRERQTHFHDLAANGKCQVVEGPIERFVAMPKGGNAYESFEVAGVQFMYSDFVDSGAFNQSLSYGGPVLGSSYVRICYDPVGNHILKLEKRKL